MERDQATRSEALREPSAEMLKMAFLLDSQAKGTVTISHAISVADSGWQV